MSRPTRRNAFPWALSLAEMIGTALLVLVGLSCVILMFGDGSPIPALVPDEGVRRAITGFLFGTTGAMIALSPVGKISGAHINPAVTVGFWLMGKITAGTLLMYVAAQLAGGIVGALPLFAWGRMGQSVLYGATIPGADYGVGAALIGEIVTTFAMVTLLCIFLGFRRLRRFTPAIFPLLFSLMVFVEAPISGTSTNPARTLGPAVISGQWGSWWVYWVGPLIGTFAATLACSVLARRIEVAKLYHFDTANDRLARRGRPLVST
jgi:aquaporin Z